MKIMHHTYLIYHQYLYNIVTPVTVVKYVIITAIRIIYSVYDMQLSSVGLYSGRKAPRNSGGVRHL